MQYNSDQSIETIQEIRKIMDRSTRFFSLSGWSGIWAGGIALIGASIAYQWFLPVTSHDGSYRESLSGVESYTINEFMQLLSLAVVIFVTAFIGAYYFTLRKVRKDGGKLWNTASKAMLRSAALPMICGAVFCFAFAWHGEAQFFAPTCLVFYGLALYNGSKYTLTDIRYLGILEIALGTISLFLPGYGLAFWTIGFGLLHILYGIIMWKKYDKAAV